MLNIRLVSVGTLKEPYLRDAAAEYKKRLGAFAKVEDVQLKESRLPENPNEAQIHTALEEEAEAILSYFSPRALKIALCVEGKQFSSEELAAYIDKATLTAGELVFVIGSSHGLSPRVKEAADLRLSVSKLTFPHQLMRVMTWEILYRALSIIHGTRYHK